MLSTGSATSGRGYISILRPGAAPEADKAAVPGSNQGGLTPALLSA